MQKVLITKVFKKSANQTTVGMLDLEHKTLYIPYQGKKHMCIDTVEFSWMKTTDKGYQIEDYVVDDEGRTYTQLYYVNIIK